MNSPFGKLNFRNIVSAVVSAVIVAILGYLSNLTDIFSVDTGQLLNVAVLTAITSLLKALGTDENSKLLGRIQL